MSVAVALALVGAAVLAGCLPPGPGLRVDESGATVPNPAPYEGLGTWVDVWDWAPSFQGGGRPDVDEADVEAMAAAGVRTVYLQVARDDPRSPGTLVDPERLGALLARAQQRGMRVVAWYLPTFHDLEADLARLVAAFEFRHQGHAFDGIGVDIEERTRVADPAERSRRLVELSQRLRARVGAATLGAIVVPPVAIDIVNPNYWPGFPWAELAPLYDVWLPMGYFTNRTVASGWRDADRYTRENVRLLRDHLGDPQAPVHAIGGLGDKSSVEDCRAFAAAAEASATVGWSFYDWGTTSEACREVLRPRNG